MGEHGFDSNNGVNEVTILECRTCLHIMSPDAVMFNIFERWTPPWDGMANTIAEDLEILAKVKVQQLDKHSKVICRTCYELLHSACTFTSIVKRSDQILQQRFPEEQEADKVWPKPIQLEKSFNSCMQEESMNVEIKEEVLSDNEYDDPNSVCENGEGFATLDIKVEPEEMIQQQPSEQFTVNGSLTVNTFGGADLTHLTNGSGEENLLTKIKEEPLNEEEIEPTQANDLPLSCMLCSKDFNCVTGLKPACSNSMADNTMPQNEEASSLLQTKNDTTKWTGAKRGRPKKKKRGRPKSQRSRSEQRREASRKYQRKKAARRKAAAESTVTISEANQKAIATYSAPHSTSVKVDSSNHSEIVKKKNDDYYFHFTTSTDLMVHETCHNKSVCYGCNESFDTFEQLTKHRQTCKAIASQEVKKLKTLDDVLRPQPQEHKTKLDCPQCDETFTDIYYLTIHQEIQHTSDSDKLDLQEDSGMEVEALENIFSDNSEF